MLKFYSRDKLYKIAEIGPRQVTTMWKELHECQHSGITFFLFLIFVDVLGFDVAKTGDARIGFVGFPSVGKSTLLSNLAGVYSEVAAYEFTTLTTVPGVIRYKGAKIQVSQSCRTRKGGEAVLSFI